MSQTRIMSIHRLLMCLFLAFCLGKALNGNVKHFVFDLTFDVTGDLEVKFLNLIWNISSRPFHCRLNFSPTSVGFRDRWGGRYGPPPQQRVGSGLGPAGRGLTLASGRGVDATPPWVFLNCTPNRLEYHAEIFYSLWGVLCATFGEKKLVRSGQVTKLWRHKGNNLRQDFNEIVSKRNLAWCDWLEWGQLM